MLDIMDKNGFFLNNYYEKDLIKIKNINIYS